MQKLTDYGNKKLIAENIAKLLKLKETYREYAKNIEVAVNPITEMAVKIAKDLGLGVSNNGITIATDYLETDAEIILPTHKNADLDIIKRVCSRYIAVIEGARG
ncbi:MAG: hypothetical protein ACE5J3_09235 [Methanosarcinales archaeon]